MGAVTKLFVITLLAVVYTNGAYVENYVPMDLTNYRDGTTEATPEITPENKGSEETKTSNESKDSEEIREMKEVKSNEDEQNIEKQQPSEDDGTSGDLERKKKSATTTFCVEIRPSDPYQKPFQVCEPASAGNRPSGYPQQGYHQPQSGYHQPQSGYHQPQSGYHQPQSGYHQPQSGYHQPQPTYQNHPTHHQPNYPPKTHYQPPQGQHPEPAYQPSYNTPAKKPQTGYAASPTYSQQPAAPAPQPIAPHDYQPPVMVVPHVPVAEPYHVPQPQGRPGSSVYRTSGGWDLEEGDVEDEINANPRTAYNSYESHDSYGGGHGKSIYKYEKDKKIDYIPVMVKTIKKTKPLKFLKVYKDIKKGKLKLYDDGYGGDDYGYGGSEYGGHEYGGHGGHEYGGGHGGYGGYGGHGSGGHGYGGHGYGGETEYHHEPEYGHHGGNQHGLVITCQPSAVGYAGGDSHVELQRHMDLLKNLYSASEKLFPGAPKTEYSLGPVAQTGYGVSAGAGHSAGVAPSVSSGSDGGYVPPSTYRTSGGEQWKPAEQQKTWDQATQSRSSNGDNWQPTNWEAQKQMNEKVGSAPQSSAQPMMVNPTENTQKQMDTTSAFRNNRQQSMQ